MYILAFQRSPLEDYSKPPEDLPASVSYRVDVTRCCTLPEGVFRDIWQDDPQRQAELGCPVSGHPRVLPAAWEVQTSFQPFEHGAMIWSDHTGWYGVRIIFVLHPDGTYQQFFDSYDPSVDPVSGGESPPAGLVEPILGFGKVWREEPGVREALGWATAPESPGAGRYQIFSGGDMIWLSQRQEVYTLFDETYTVVDRPSFEIPTPTPPSDAARLVNRWVPRYLRDGVPPASQTFAFGADGTLKLHNCAGSYELRGRDKVFINTDNCAAPELVTGLYEYAFEAAGDILVLRQRFRNPIAMFSSMQWHQEDNDYAIDLSGAGISVVGEPCSGVWEYQQECTYRIDWTECAAGESPLAPGFYEFIYVGAELTIGRNFVRAAPQTDGQ